MALFTNVFEDVTKQGKKLPTSMYRERGKYAIIDQGQNDIAGYTDETEGLFTDIPAIVFGDHTRVIKYVDFPCFLGADGVKLLKAKVSNPNYKYLFYALSYVDIPNTGYNRHFKWLKEVDINLPDADEQRDIVENLDKVCNLIELRKQQLSKLDELVKARFVEMFGLPGTDNFRWGLTTLGKCCEINPKKNSDARLYAGLEVSFVPMPAVSEQGDIDASQVKTYGEVKSGFTYFAEGDVLFAKITPCMENGKGAVATGLANGIGFGSTEFHVLRPQKGRTDAKWVYILTAFPQFREDAANNMTGSAGQRRVPASFLENYRISLPPYELQVEFATFVKSVDKLKSQIKQSLEKLETLKKALMQKYFH